MLKHHLLLAFRNFKRNKTSFFINLIGLSTGLACVLLIYLWVDSELSVDKFHDQEKQLYQVMKNNTEPHGISTGETTPGPLARSLVEEFPEVLSSVLVFPPSDYTLKGILGTDKNFVKARSKFTGKDFFNMFTYTLIQGDKDQVLADPASIVISKELALNMFNTTHNVVGKRVIWKGERHTGEYTIAGIFNSPPSSASIQFDVVFNDELMLKLFKGFEGWSSNGPSTFITLRENTDIARFGDKIANFIKSKDSESTNTLFIRHYSDRYLYSDYENGVLVGGRIEYVRLFSVIALFILLIACINFMNLSTARSSLRLKEIGVKRAVGANRKTIFYQFLGESILLIVLSFIVAIALVLIFLPQFNAITGKQLSLIPDLNLTFSVLAITLVAGLMAGIYPAAYLSGFNPIATLKAGGFSAIRKKSEGEMLVRKGLVVFQFFISTLLIISVIVVYQQMEFIQSKNLGYDRENVITFYAEGKVKEDPETFLSEIKKIPGVINASFMDGDLISMHSGTTGVDWEGKSSDQVVDFEILGTGYELVETLGIELQTGRTFSREFGNESSKVLFNEAAIESMGLSNPIGQTVKIWGEEKQIIGVVKNFHFESLYKNVNPFFFTLSNRARNIVVKIDTSPGIQTLTQLRAFYQTFNLGLPLDFRFLDEDYQKLYSSETRVAILSRYFAGFAVLISCLGLFGLAIFNTEIRSREIGIRKVMGSTVAGILYLISKDFLRLVLIAGIIAIPISWWIMERWLQTFNYHIEMGLWIFTLAIAASLVITIFTVGFQSIKAALTNPADVLRSE